MTPGEKEELTLARHAIRNSKVPLSKQPTGSLKVSVVIVTYQRRAVLECILEQLCEQEYQNLEIVVVDGSPDAAALGLSPQFSEKVVYVVSRVPYYGVVRNLGILHSSGDIVIFVDDDSYIDSDFVSRHVALHESVVKDAAQVVIGNSIARPNEPSDWVKRVNDRRPGGRFASDFGVGWQSFSLNRSLAAEVGFLPYIRVSGDEIEFFTRLRKRGVNAINGHEILLVHRSVRSGGNRDLVKQRVYMATCKAADRVLCRLNRTGTWALPFLMAGGLRQLGQELRGCGLITSLLGIVHDYLAYCLKYGPRTKHALHFREATRIGEPHVFVKGKRLSDSLAPVG